MVEQAKILRVFKLIDCLKKNHVVIPIIEATDATKRINKNRIFKN